MAAIQNEQHTVIRRDEAEPKSRMVAENDSFERSISRRNVGATFEQKMQSGFVAGLFGGALFGVMLATTDMLPMIAGMVGADHPVTGFIVHMIISFIIGGGFALLMMRWSGGLLWNVAIGLCYAVFWWVAGALILMPLALDMDEMMLVVGNMQMMSLIGHLIFGIALAVTYELLVMFR